MSTKVSQNRFMTLSLRRNRLKVDEQINKRNRSPEVIVLDESFEQLNSYLTERTKTVPKMYSPIVINDSSDRFNDSNQFNDSDQFNKSNHLNNSNRFYDSDLPRIIISNNKVPSRTGNVSFNNSMIEEDGLNHPSIGGTWSPAQNIHCATPKTHLNPTTPKDVANISQDECTMKQIEISQKKILNDLYGDVWKSVPNLFKNKKVDLNSDGVTKRLNFCDDDEFSNKANFRAILAENKKLYLAESEVKRRVQINDDAEGCAKRKLYTEKVQNTPKLKTLAKKRDVKSTTKKVKGNTVTEILKNMETAFGGLSPNSENKENEEIWPIKVNKTIEDTKTTKQSKIKPNENNVERLSFMASLADNIPSWRCNIEAIMYKDNFKNKREQLTRKLFKEFNSRIFNNELDNDMLVTWDTKLRSTAGITINRRIKTSKGEKHRASSIKLSVKVVDSPLRLRDTLVHEMCHSATWLIDHELRAGHGPLWKNWAIRALRAIPELVEISRCHDLAIHYKYSYKCMQCGYSIQRHSKSIDPTKKCCGYCQGTFQLSLNKKTKDGHIVSTPARQGQTSEFALFVKEKYGTLKTNGRSHAEVMKILGQKFTQKKIAS